MEIAERYSDVPKAISESLRGTVNMCSKAQGIAHGENKDRESFARQTDLPQKLNETARS
jgi:hypothetical protein